MNRYFLNTIYSSLSKGIDSGYRHGISSIVKLNLEKNFTTEHTENTEQKNFRVRANFANKPDPLYSIEWTKVDQLAVKRFLMEAFMVAGVGSYSLQEELKKLGVEVMDGTIPDFDTFEWEVRKKMLEYGIGLGTQPPTGWLETNLNTAVTTSVHAARWNRLNDSDVSQVYPGLQYRTQRDAAVREEHRALDGKVFYKDDPVWNVIYPPNGWNCRCYVVPITMADELMSAVERTTTDSRKIYDAEVAPDFRHNAGEDKSVWGRWLKMQLKGMPEGEVNKLKEMLRK